MTYPLLSVKNLNITFNRKVHAVRDVSFEIEQNQCIGIVGESGCGKTTLIRAILGLPAAGRVVTGSIRFKGKELTEMTKKAKQRLQQTELAMIFQDPMSFLNPTMKIGKQITESLLLYDPKLTRKEAQQTAIEWLERLKIAEPSARFHQYPHQLSGGMRQRIMLAMALAKSPSLLLADEPTTALDVTVQAQFLALLSSLQKKLKMAILLITHNLNIALSFCDRILVMYGGEIVESSPTALITQTPKHPYTDGLLRSIPHFALDKQAPLHVIEGSPPSLENCEHKLCPFLDRCHKKTSTCYKRKPPKKTLHCNKEIQCFLEE